MLEIDSLLLIVSLLLLVSIGIARISDLLGLPALVIFLGIGMLAGSEGPGGIYFDSARLAQAIGVVALIIILFAGGLDTNWRNVRPVLARSISLATLGVLLTALAVGAFAVYVLHMPVLFGFLLGAVISSTDAAAVFSVLRSRDISLRGGLAPLLEMESGSNDPMAVFLTVGLLQFATAQGGSAGSLIWFFVQQMLLGALFGGGLGRIFVVVVNRIGLSSQGIYPVFMVAFAAVTYAATASLGGSGFLAVYIAGIIIGNSDFIHKRSLLRFFDGLAWLSQIGMFLTLGLLVFPSHLLPVATTGLMVSGFLMFVARPLAVFVGLARSSMLMREKLFVSWVGLRGAVPIILATFPLMVGFSEAGLLFNLVFFTVVTSALLQGWSIPFVAKLLRVDAPITRRVGPVVEFAGAAEAEMETLDFIVPFHAFIAGKAIVEIGLPQKSLIVMITRGDDYIVPSGGTVLEEGDTTVILACKADVPTIRNIFSRLRDIEVA